MLSIYFPYCTVPGNACRYQQCGACLYMRVSYPAQISEGPRRQSISGDSQPSSCNISACACAGGAIESMREREYSTVPGSISRGRGAGLLRLVEDSVGLINVISLGWVGEVTWKGKAPQLEGIPCHSLDPGMCPSSKFRGWWCHKQWPQSARISLPSAMGSVPVRNHEKPSVGFGRIQA